MSPETSADLVGEFEHPTHVPIISKDITANNGFSDFIFSYFSSELGQRFYFRQADAPWERG
jgi:IS30 family transposase